MTKDIKQIQEHNREAIICAVHNTEDYEEALKKDLVHSHFTKINGKLFNYLDGKELTGKPLTLDRVLIFIRKNSHNLSFCGGDFVNEMFFKNWDDMDSLEIDWDLTKPTLEQQTEETQLAIAKLTGYNINN
jgi:hypothetical protein